MRALVVGSLVVFVILAAASLPAGLQAQLGAGDQPRPQPAGQAMLASAAQAKLASSFDASTLDKTPKIDSTLERLYQADRASRMFAGQAITAANVQQSGVPEVAAAVAAHQLRIDAASRVVVWAQAASSVDAAAADLTALGMQVERTDARQQIVQGLLPIAQLDAARQLPSVTAIRQPQYGFVQTGSVDSQGDAILNAPALRTALTGATGKGVKVGIISDGMEGMASSQATQDLAAVDTTTCNVVSGTPSPTATGAGAEGTAMAEIVHDLAPDAQLMFGYFGINVTNAGTSADFNAAVNCLALNNDIVVDDIGWFNVGPYDGSSAVSQNTTAALNNPANRIRGYYTANANQAMEHYRESYVYSGSTINPAAGIVYGLHQFQATANTTDGGAHLACPFSAGSCGDTIELAPNGFAVVFLQWNDPINGSSNDYDLLVQDNFGTGTFGPLSDNVQDGTPGSHPFEQGVIQNTHGVNTVYNILIGNWQNSASPTKTFDMFMFCSGCFLFNTGKVAPDQFADHNYNTLAGSVPNQSDAGGGVVSVGAAGASTPGTIEPYSSRGPTVDNRTKPDITGIDGVAITGAAGFENPFYGTSAAAPHIAAVAALLLSCNPTLLAGKTGSVPTATARTTLHDALLNGATFLGPANTFGAGRANTTASAPFAGCIDTDGDGYPDGLETTLGKNPNTYCAAMRADLNGDGVVTILDLSLAAGVFNQSIPPAPARYNQNPATDSKITILDLSLMAGQFNRNISSCP